MDISIPSEGEKRVTNKQKGRVAMSSIKPFRAVRYSAEKIKDLGKGDVSSLRRHIPG